MKTLVSTITLIIQLSTVAIAQNIGTSNQIQISTEVEDSVTTVSWVSTKEVNSSYYILEKSVNGSEFKTIHTEQASGSTHAKTSYEFEDLDYSSSDTQYRVTLVFMDGSRLAVLNQGSDSSAIAQK